MFSKIKDKLKKRAIAKALEAVAKAAPGIVTSDIKTSLVIKAIEIVLNYLKALQKEFNDGIQPDDFKKPVDSIEKVKALLK